MAGGSRMLDEGGEWGVGWVVAGGATGGGRKCYLHSDSQIDYKDYQQMTWHLDMPITYSCAPTRIKTKPVTWVHLRG